MTPKYAIEVRALEKSFGDVHVLAGVDMSIRRGSIFSLLGPNGAGKTTVVRILSTLSKADGGSARVAGYDVRQDVHEVRRRISLTGQYAAVDDLQTAHENLRMMGRLGGLTARVANARAGYLLDRFGLADAGRRRVGTYSGGMRRRLDLAASLVGTPEVIFLDEPTTGLDLPSRQAMWEIITELAAGSGVTVFLTTQYLEEADQLSDRIAVLDGGRIIADGTAAELKARVAEQRLELTATSGDAYDQLIWTMGSRSMRANRDRRIVSVATDGSAAHVRAVLDEADPRRDLIERFAVHSATLDDVFLTLTGHASENVKETDNMKERVNV